MRNSMLISSAGSRQGHGDSRRQSQQQRPRQEVPQQSHAPRPTRIALVEADRRRDGGQHPVPTPDRHQSRGPPIDRTHEVAGRHGDRDGQDINDDDDDDEIDEDESYEDEEGADEYRHQFDYNGARSTVEPVQDDEPVCQVRYPAPRRNHGNNGAAAEKEHKQGEEDEDDEEEDDDSASAYSQDETDSQVDSDDSDGDDDGDDDGYGTLVALCRRWRSARLQVDALSAAAKTLRHERKDLEKRLITHMSRRNIAKEDAFGSLPGDRRVKVTVVRAPASCSVSDQVLSAAVYKRLSVQLAHECALAEANKASRASSSAARGKKRTPTGALPTPQAKHQRHTPSPEPGSPPTASDRAARPNDDDNVDDSGDHTLKSRGEHADHSFSLPDAASQDGSSDDEDDEDDSNNDDDDDGIVHGISLAKAIGAALTKARREAQETLAQPRFTVHVVVYPAAEAMHKHEPFVVPVMTDENGNEADEEAAWDRWLTMSKAERRAMAAAAKAAAAEAAARVELSPEAAQWAGRIHEIDQALEQNRAKAGPLRALMAALTVDLPDAQSTTTTPPPQNTTATTTPDGNADDVKKPLKARTKAAEAKRLRHAQHASMRDRVAAYLATNCPHADERGGLAVRFVAPRSATGGGGGAPVTYRIRAVERARNGNMGVRRYATAATAAAAASLAAVGLDPARPYSPARLQEAFGDRGVRSRLLDALKRAIAAERQACKPPLTRNLVITKAPSGKRST